MKYASITNWEIDVTGGIVVEHQGTDDAELSQLVVVLLGLSKSALSVCQIAEQLAADGRVGVGVERLDAILADLQTQQLIETDLDNTWKLRSSAPEPVSTETEQPDDFETSSAIVVPPGRAVVGYSTSLMSDQTRSAAMTSASRQLYEWAFRAQFAEKSGSEFQRFFEMIMETKHGGSFRKVKAGGQSGDEKNDGYLPDQRMYFQVYAPGTGTQAKAAKKMDDDFEGAVAVWDVETWVFVHNDSDGLSSAINKKIDELDKRHEGIRAVVWSREDLRRVLFSMSEDDVAMILGARAASPATMGELEMQDLTSVIGHVISQPDNPLAPVEPVPPDKASRNRLSAGVEELLTIGMMRMSLVEQYFDTDPSPDLGSRIAASLNREYLRLRDTGLSADDIFQALWRHVGGSSRQPTTAHESAVLAVLAYFFWTCDIFERVEA